MQTLNFNPNDAFDWVCVIYIYIVPSSLFNLHDGILSMNDESMENIWGRKMEQNKLNQIRMAVNLRTALMGKSIRQYRENVVQCLFGRRKPNGVN